MQIKYDTNTLIINSSRTVRETCSVILVSEADRFLSKSLRILAERKSQSFRLRLKDYLQDDVNSTV